MFGIIAKWRARHTYRKHGYNQDLNPYTPRTNCFFWCLTDNWTYWYDAHREEHYKDVIPDYNPKDPPTSFWEF